MLVRTLRVSDAHERQRAVARYTAQRVCCPLGVRGTVCVLFHGRGVARGLTALTAVSTPSRRERPPFACDPRTPVCLPFRDLSNPFSSYPWNCQAPPSGIHSPLAVRQNLPSPAPSGPKFNVNVCTAAPVSKFIFTHSNLFGPLVALTSKPPSENELTEVLYVCSQPSCHPTELQSSFHSSKLQPQFHSSPFQPSFQEVSVAQTCPDS